MKGGGGVQAARNLLRNVDGYGPPEQLAENKEFGLASEEARALHGRAVLPHVALDHLGLLKGRPLVHADDLEASLHDAHGFRV